MGVFLHPTRMVSHTYIRPLRVVDPPPTFFVSSEALGGSFTARKGGIKNNEVQC